MVPTPPAPRTTLAVASLLLVAAVGTPTSPLPVQEAADDQQGRVGGPGSANYELASRFAPYELEELVHDLRVDPQWIEDTERFWYDFETAEGKRYWIVDPEEGTQREIFDRERLAAELTRITRDPWDAKHLPLENLRFVDGTTLRFDVQSSEEAEEEEKGEIEEQREKQDVEGGADEEDETRLT